MMTKNISPAIDVKDDELKLVWIAPSDLSPSPENEDIYHDSEESLGDLVESIKEKGGVIEPLVITKYDYVVSGHRRREASIRAGLPAVPCRVLPVRRKDIPKDDYLKLLREFNRQRSKSIADIIREAAIDADPEAAWVSLVEERVRQCNAAEGQFQIQGVKKRFAISPAKQPFLNGALTVIEQLRPFWPLTVRQIHYSILSNPVLRNSDHPESLYRNDRASYQDLCDVLARARISGQLDWNIIKDETRPIRVWEAWPHVGEFITSDLSGLFSHYWRDSMRSQPDHLEIIVEKNTSLSVVERVAMKYCIPVTSARGHSSKEPLYQMAQRYEASGKRNLILLLLSDFDPDGDSISNSLAKSLRDDFNIPEGNIIAVRVAIRPDQVNDFNLPKTLEVKTTSSNYTRFVEEHGVDFAVELEAMNPEDLQSELDNAIRSHLDVNLFNKEIAEEKREAAKLQSLKRRALEFITEAKI